jgi:hypothetical protein
MLAGLTLLASTRSSDCNNEKKIVSQAKLLLSNPNLTQERKKIKMSIEVGIIPASLEESYPDAYKIVLQTIRRFAMNEVVCETAEARRSRYTRLGVEALEENPIYACSVEGALLTLHEKMVKSGQQEGIITSLLEQAARKKIPLDSSGDEPDDKARLLHQCIVGNVLVQTE